MIIPYYTLGLRKQCESYETKTYDYHLQPLDRILNGQPDGYMVRLAFYVIAGRDAHIIFTTNDHPSYQVDAAYEICKPCVFNN